MKFCGYFSKISSNWRQKNWIFEKIREINWIWRAMVFIPREFCVQFHCTKKSLGKKSIARKIPSNWRIFWKHQKLLTILLYSKPCDNRNCRCKVLLTTYFKLILALVLTKNGPHFYTLELLMFFLHTHTHTRSIRLTSQRE